jgi:transposase
MVPTGRLVLPNLDGMDSVPIQIERPKKVKAVCPQIIASSSLHVIKGKVTIRLAADTPALRIAEIMAVL